MRDRETETEEERQRQRKSSNHTTVKQEKSKSFNSTPLNLFLPSGSNDGKELVFFSNWQHSCVPTQDTQDLVAVAVQLAFEHHHYRDCCSHEEAVAFERVDVPEAASDIDRQLQREETQEHGLEVELRLDLEIIVDMAEEGG